MAIKNIEIGEEIFVYYGSEYGRVVKDKKKQDIKKSAIEKHIIDICDILT